jgi:hypothetical protein
MTSRMFGGEGQFNQQAARQKALRRAGEGDLMGEGTKEKERGNRERGDVSVCVCVCVLGGGQMCVCVCVCYAQKMLRFTRLLPFVRPCLFTLYKSEGKYT